LFGVNESLLTEETVEPALSYPPIDDWGQPLHIVWLLRGGPRSYSYFFSRAVAFGFFAEEKAIGENHP
jgi:hypothetical protein